MSDLAHFDGHFTAATIDEALERLYDELSTPVNAALGDLAAVRTQRGVVNTAMRNPDVQKALDAMPPKDRDIIESAMPGVIGGMNASINLHVEMHMQHDGRVFVRVHGAPNTEAAHRTRPKQDKPIVSVGKPYDPKLDGIPEKVVRLNTGEGK